MDAAAVILNVQRMSTEDGPGIRTTLFLKGCSLACRWCHNPESISRRPQTVWNEWKCVGCHGCDGACPNGALCRGAAGPVIDRARCRACGTCADGCPGGALEVLGRRRTVGEVLADLLRDRAFYQASGGGVTVSGGEPALRPSFVEPLLEGLHAAKVHAALDTCGMVAAGPLLRLAALADLVLYDVKEIDSARHEQLTGSRNERILENLRAVGDVVRRSVPRKALWVRTPLVPGATATDENLRGIGRWLAEHDVPVQRWDLCAFNNLHRDKCRRLGVPDPCADTPLLTDDELRGFEQVARGSGVDPEIVHAGGPTRAPTAT